MTRGRGICGVFRHKLKPLPWPLMIIFLFLIAAIIVSGFFYYQKQKKDALHEQTAQLQAIADLKATEIKNWLSERMGDARVIAENPVLKAELLAFLRDPSPGSRRDAIKGWMESLENNYHYQNVLLLDPAGKLFLTLDGRYPAIGSEGLKLIEAVRRAKKALISDLHLSTQVALIHLDVVAPLLAENSIEGFVLLRIDPAQFLYPIIQSWPTPSPSSETLLVRREGGDVLYLNELRHRKDTAMKLRLPISSQALPSARAALGKTGVFPGRDYRGVAVWSVFKPVPDSNWMIVAKVDRDEIERPLRRSALAIFLVALSLILAAALMILFLWQRQSTRFRLRQLEQQQESEEKFKQVFETANVGKSITQLSGEINVNQAFCAMLGFSREELQKKKWQELTPLDEIEAVQKVIEPLLQGRQDAARFNKRYIHKNGSYIWGDVSTVIRRDPAGKPLHFITTVVDITERKRVEEKLQQEQTLYMDLVNALPAGMYRLKVKPAEKWSTDSWRSQVATQYIIDFVSDRFCAITGIDRQEFIANPGLVPDRIHPDDSVEFSRRNAEAILSMSTFSWEGRMLVPGKGTIWIRFESIPRPLENGVVVWTGILNDISKRKRAEIDLQQLFARNQAMLEAVPDIIMEVDANKVYTWANHAGIEFFGADTIGREAAFYFEGEQSTYKIVNPIFHGREEVIYVESWQRRHDGEKRLLAWWCRVLKDGSGRVTGALSSARDITEIKLAENEILRLNEELEQRVRLRTAQLEAANKELEAFSYSVSHDLRAPLRAIDGFSRLVLEEYASKLDDEGKRLLAVIRGNTHKMGQLIDDLLAFSRLSRQQVIFAPVDLAALADTVFFELKNSEKGRKIELEIDALPAAFGDRSMLRQVLQNLLANAIKFTRPRSRARIELSGRTGKDENIYQVKDNGVGFDTEYAHKLFGVFQRLHNSEEFEGTGVGLAIVQRIVLRHGGRVWAESKGGKGATFYFSLPAEQDKGSRG
jgi:two-component system sensor histidine kinase/response regulator